MNERPEGNQRSGGNGSAATHPHAREFVEQSQRVREDIAVLAQTARGVAQDWEAILRDRLERRPYATLAAAVGIGYWRGPDGRLWVCVDFGGI